MAFANEPCKIIRGGKPDPMVNQDSIVYLGSRYGPVRRFVHSGGITKKILDAQIDLTLRRLDYTMGMLSFPIACISEPANTGRDSRIRFIVETFNAMGKQLDSDFRLVQIEELGLSNESNNIPALEQRMTNSTDLLGFPQAEYGTNMSDDICDNVGDIVCDNMGDDSRNSKEQLKQRMAVLNEIHSRLTLICETSGQKTCFCELNTVK